MAVMAVFRSQYKMYWPAIKKTLNQVLFSNMGRAHHIHRLAKKLHLLSFTQEILASLLVWRLGCRSFVLDVLRRRVVTTADVDGLFGRTREFTDLCVNRRRGKGNVIRARVVSSFWERSNMTEHFVRSENWLERSQEKVRFLARAERMGEVMNVPGVIANSLRVKGRYSEKKGC